MSWRYDENWIKTRVGPTYYDLYAKYGRKVGDDPDYAVWPSRTLADIYENNFAPEASLSKHRDECEAILKGGGPPDPTPGKRDPLPPFPQPQNYRATLPWEPPTSRDFLRADSWGVTLPGAPIIPGGSTKHPERILSWIHDRLPVDWQKAYLDTYKGYGYTHMKLSYADSTAPSGGVPGKIPPGSGMTLAQFIGFCANVKKYVPYVQVVIGSKYWQPANMTADQWAEFADPVMEQLIANGVVDEFILGWEWNLWNTPGSETIKAFKHAGQLAHASGKSFWMHFSPHYTSWFADGDPRGRFGFYDDLGNDVDGLNYQTNGNPDGSQWSLKDLQDRIVDSLWQFGTQQWGHKFRLDEDSASWMFDGDHPNQDESDLRGYIGCCTIDDVKHTDAKVWGFGNGGRMPDGSRI